ncbi:MAG: FAD-dependent oxidoreductase [Actinobacteria bacterium]|nr:FAD-dependent oxidoreductase [Actinomycetota bacterium]
MAFESRSNEVIVLGGGLAGLSAGYALSQANRRALVLESDSTVGGLSKTIIEGEFRFDLGGHRFITKSIRIENFIKDLMGEELLTVPRSSKICLRNKYFDYPLKPSNAIFGLGVPTTLKILSDYGIERVRNHFRAVKSVSLEDWVVSQFGRTMFNIYFKEYSEKVWGLECSQISAEWVAKRIQGLSLGAAIKNAFFKFSGRGIPTLADKFLYPSLGIGRISDKLREAIDENGRVLTSTRIETLHHSDSRIESLTARNGDGTYKVRGYDFISSIPITTLVNMLHPRAPKDILASASRLRYRDLVIVATILNRERVTNQTWIYIPERKISLGRIHEPKNWSLDMAPADKTLLVTEYFCFEDDEIWSASDDQLADNTIHQLGSLGFIKNNEVLGSIVVRVPKAYPLLEVGYQEHYDKILDYLDQFQNLHIIGRSGMFKYLNMDHAIETGLEMAERIMKKRKDDKLHLVEGERMALAGDAG